MRGRTLVDIWFGLAVLTFVACGGRVGTDPPPPTAVTARGGSSGIGGRGGVSGNGGNAGIAGTGGTHGGGASGDDAGDPADSDGTAGGAGDGGLEGSTGTTSPDASADRGNSSPPGPGNACWRNAIRDVEPIVPTFSEIEACSHAANNPPWISTALPAIEAGDGMNIDNKPFIVGRWVSCSGDAPDAIEFGTNNRWRHWARDPSGAFVPIAGDPPTSRGTFHFLDNGQLNLVDDRALERIVGWNRPVGTASPFVETLPNKEVIRVGDGAPLVSGIYARVPSSPLNGWDNPPRLESPPCRLVGTWDATGVVDGAPSEASFSFDEAGNFVGAAGIGADLCSAPSMYGTYALGPGAFLISTNVGMGKCAFWTTAGYPIQFDADCSKAQIERANFDNCRGRRGYFDEPTTLVKRRGSDSARRR
ncbi:MAG: hypothetical protein ABW133_19500 [Polyangiaceae bacterium]